MSPPYPGPHKLRKQKITDWWCLQQYDTYTAQEARPQTTGLPATCRGKSPRRTPCIRSRRGKGRAPRGTPSETPPPKTPPPGWCTSGVEPAEMTPQAEPGVIGCVVRVVCQHATDGRLSFFVNNRQGVRLCCEKYYCCTFCGE